MNYSSPEGKFPEVLAAKFALIAKSERHSGKYLVVDQEALDKLASESDPPEEESPH